MQSCFLATVMSVYVKHVFSATRCRWSILRTQARRLSLLEYQSKDILARHGVNVQKFRTAGTPDEAARISSELDASEYVVKAQVSRCVAGVRGLLRSFHVVVLGRGGGEN